MYTPPPSSLKPDYSSLIEWLIFLFLIALAFYATWVVKNEKKNYKQDASYQTLGAIKFLIANWWSLKNQNSSELTYHRADTRYDWEGIFQKKNSNDPAKDAAKNYLNEQKIELDNSYESFGESSKPEHLFSDQKLRENVEDFYRCESIGTHDGTKRVYVDVVVFRLKNANELYLCSSISSVLNGCVEGPYFEEALVNAKLV